MYEINVNKHYFVLMPEWCVRADPETHHWAECKVIEDRWKLSENYKVELEPVDQEHFSRVEFHVGDFDMLRLCGSIVEKTSDDMHVDNLTVEEFVGGTKIVHSGDCIVWGDESDDSCGIH